MKKGGRNRKSAPSKKRPKATIAAKNDSVDGSIADIRLVKSIIKNLNLAIAIIEIDGKVTFATKPLSRICGRKKGSFDLKSMLKNAVPEDKKKVRSMLGPALRRRTVTDFGIVRIRSKGGSHCALRAIYCPFKDSNGAAHIIAFFSDVTAAMESKRALLESERRFHSMANNAQDMMFMVNSKGIIEYVNNASSKEFKLKPQQLMGRPLKDFFPSYIYKRQSSSLGNVFKSGKPFYIANETAFPEGQKLIDTWLVPIKDESGKVNSVFGVSRDVTSYRQMAFALKLKTAEADEAKLRAQMYLDFLAHDIANLISPVMTYSDELVKKGLDDPEAEKHLKKINELTQRTARLIMNLRMLVEAEKCPQITSERFNLGEYFKDLQQTVAQKLPERCQMTLDLPKGVPVEVIGGQHIKNAFMQGFSTSMELNPGTCIRVNVKILPVRKGTRQFWQVRMDMLDRPLDVNWQDHVIPPFDPSRRIKGISMDGVAFSSAIIRHFGGNMRDEHIDPKNPSKGHTIVIELPKAGTWRHARNT